ncbi:MULTISPECIES: LCP family protein [Actinomyces]|uniref:LCP family protein n=1 Tax=Actinomyces TaxID=1654 RepID=UPI001F3F896F|nr:MULTISPECIES: LCP family protein [Actinomyces]
MPPTRQFAARPAQAAQPAQAARPAQADPWAQPPLHQAGPPVPPPQPARPRRRRRGRPLRWIAVVLVLALTLVAGRILWLAHRVEDSIGRVDALSGAADTAGQTWLIVGSDSRADGTIQDETEGARADSIMLLHRAQNGTTALVSLPRDTYVEIPDHGGDKINASYSYGGAPLLVATVEDLTGLTVDHYVEVGMGGVTSLVDAVGGIEVCLDYDVEDPDSGLVWHTADGECQTVDGTRALAYSRMRKADPLGDIGRALRQRAVVSAVVSEAMSTETLLSLSRQDALVEAGASTLTVDEGMGSVDLARMVLAFRNATGSGLMGAPPIESLDYEPGGIGAAVLLENTTAPDFFESLRDGTLTTEDFNQLSG